MCFMFRAGLLPVAGQYPCVAVLAFLSGTAVCGGEDKENEMKVMEVPIPERNVQGCR